MVILGIGLFSGGCTQKSAPASGSLKNPEAAGQLKTFVAEKEAQVDALAGEPDVSVFKPFFTAVDKGNWLAISNAFAKLERRAPQYEHSGPSDERLHGTAWEAVKEIWGAYDAFSAGGGKYSMDFGTNIIGSITPGSVYFGGTDPGRFIVTALQKSHVNADPFFTLTQNALADSTYLDYLRAMYGGKIYVPTLEDSQHCFEDYMEDAQTRMAKGKLKPGEDVRMVEGKVQVSGQVAVMNINGLLARVIFDKNPGREFYIEESFPLDWMYPYLEPHGLIMKINRQPLAEMSDEIVRRDRDYWTKYVTPMIGDWLNPDTTVKEVTVFAEKVYLKNDLSGFKGDRQFVQSTGAQKWFSKLRSSIGGLYAWRAQHAADASERERMNDAADFTFRQAFALCPYLPEAVFRYVTFLMNANRGADALLVAETAAQMPANQGKDGEQIRGLVEQLKKFQKAK